MWDVRQGFNAVVCCQWWLWDVPLQAQPALCSRWSSAVQSPSRSQGMAAPVTGCVDSSDGPCLEREK